MRRPSRSSTSSSSSVLVSSTRDCPAVTSSPACASTRSTRPPSSASRYTVLDPTTFARNGTKSWNAPCVTSATVTFVIAIRTLRSDEPNSTAAVISTSTTTSAATAACTQCFLRHHGCKIGRSIAWLIISVAMGRSVKRGVARKNRPRIHGLGDCEPLCAARLVRKRTLFQERGGTVGFAAMNASGAVLVVEDDADVRRSARIALAPHVASVDLIEAADARLEEKLASSKFEVVLLDMNFVAGERSGAAGL